MSAVDERRRSSSGGGRSGFVLSLGVLAVWAAALWILVAAGRLPAWVFLSYGFLGPLTFIAYGTDKAAARRDRSRIPEATLHVISVLGGWPGALVAQRVFRHKTVKRSFRAVFWVTVLVNCPAMMLLSMWWPSLSG
jgi:uncharacterized membrane protein YsdA (DUF1294 family)